MKTNIFAVLALSTALSAGLQSCTDTKGNSKSVPGNAEPIPVKVMPLERSSVTTVIKASGQLTTNDETILGFKTGGVVRSIYVKEGDFVRKGQTLASLDLREIDAGVSQAKHSFEKAQRDLQRARNLFADSVATLEQLQNAETAFAVAKEQLDAVNFNKDYSIIRATSDGYVLRKFVNPGRVVDVGDPILMTNGAGSSDWILKIGVSDRQWASLSLRSKAIVTIDAFSGKTFDAFVVRKSEVSDETTGAFTVELEVQPDGGKFATGMFGTAEIALSSPQDVWEVPYEAVLDANDDEGFVFITNDNKTAIKQRVTISSFDDTSINISGGLENSVALITSGSAYLTDNSPITVIK